MRASGAHPSAALVYRQVRRRLPRVSLATVYRNLCLLAAEGLLVERVDASGLRFDGKDEEHGKLSAVHFVRFPLPPAARRIFGDAEVTLVVDHPNERARAVLSPDTKRELARDLE